MPALTLKAVNAELSKRGIQVVLTKGPGYFYFHTGEAADWLDRTVRVRTVNSLTLKQWVDEFKRLKQLNVQILKTAKGSSTGKKPQTKKQS
jgi:hypothetical protein